MHECVDVVLFFQTSQQKETLFQHYVKTTVNMFYTDYGKSFPERIRTVAFTLKLLGWRRFINPCANNYANERL